MIREVESKLVNGFGSNQGGVGIKKILKLMVDEAVLVRIRFENGDVRTDGLGLPDTSAHLNTKTLGFDGRGDNTTTGLIVGSNGDGVMAKQRIGLLFNGGKAGVDIKMEDGGRFWVKGKIGRLDHLTLFKWVDRHLVPRESSEE